MNALRRKIERHYREGHGAPLAGLWQDSRLSPDQELKPAAVLMAITERPDAPGFLLLHRPTNMRSHPGQVAFPGGRLDPGETPVEAALREAWEELGIRPEDVTVIGASDVYQSGSGYEITPVLATVPADLPIHPNPTEVAQWFEAPVDFVLDPGNHQRIHVEWKGKRHPNIEIHWQQHRIWGVTGAIIANLSRRMNWHG